MSLNNKYLQETTLTSTKNKFLNDDFCAFDLKKYEPQWNRVSETLRSKLKRRFLLEHVDLTENNLLEHQGGVSQKKKKKAKKFRSPYIECQDVCDDIEYSDQDLMREGEFILDTAEEAPLPNIQGFSFSCEPLSRSLNLDNLDLSTGLPAGFGSTFPASANIQFQCSPPARSSTTFGYAASVPLVNRALFGGHAIPCSSSNILESELPEKIILEMPSYDLDVIKLHEDIEHEKFSSFTEDSTCFWSNSFMSHKKKKMQLLNVVSMALMYSSNLKDSSNTYRLFLEKSADAVRQIDPEFILKVALYARQELQIRTVANFLLSYAAFYQSTRIYLEKYFSTSIVLPTDWIQVAEFYQILSDGIQKQPFPAALRRIMRKTFSKFDKYQLAKYKKDRIKKKRNEKEQVSADENISDDDDEKDETEHSLDYQNKKKNEKLTLKKLIRRLHINFPTEHVMCLLGKKYPENHEKFKMCGLPGTWDPARAGTRMKLPIPETWETQISANGNESYVWESLIDNNKLPYMAMLRNLRNLILSGISPAHHLKVINYLENKKSVINSRQLPMQFFEAYKVITKLDELVDKGMSSQCTNPRLPSWKKALLNKTKERIENVSPFVPQQYKTAISNALEISSLNNLHPIPGKTVVICQINGDMYGNAVKTKSYETCIMTGLMCLKACEDCKMNIISSSESPDVILLNENDKFFDVLMKTCERYKELFSTNSISVDDDSCSTETSLKNILDYYLKPHTILSLKVDHIVFLQTSDGFQEIMSPFLHKYRQIVNPNLLYTNVNFTLSSNSFSDDCSSDKDVYLCGSSSSLIKFIAERSNGGQLAYVENIDVKYNLEQPQLKKYCINSTSGSQAGEPINLNDKDTSMPFIYKMPKWHTVRIFISSTFKDMMSERDLLIRYVFPELRRRAASIFIKIAEIDLRWGITETDSSTKRAAEICVTEAEKADLFVGLIGERYGSLYDFDPPLPAHLEWIEDIDKEVSITELEIYAAALRNPELCREKALFYFRDNSFLKQVPKKWKSHFLPEDIHSKIAVDGLKTKIRTQNFKIFDGYPCNWMGIFDNKPVLGGLVNFGNKVLEDLWNAIQDIHKRDPYCDGMSEEEMYQKSLINSQEFFIDIKNCPIKNVINQINSEHGIFVIYGSSGSGKTAFAIKMLENLKQQVVVKFFIGISPRSRDTSYMMQYICKSICQQLGILMPLPNLPTDIINQFPDFLFEAVNSCGGRDLILIIDGLDHLESDSQMLDWLPLSLPNRVKIICTVSESSQAFKVLCDRQEHGSAIFMQELPTFLQSDREKFIKEYLHYYSKTMDDAEYSNYMLKIVTKKDSSNPFYLRLVCDFLRFYASYDNLLSMLQKLPSSTMLLFQEIILQMENDFGSSLIQTVLTLLCITKEGIEDNDLHYILTFITQMNDLKSAPPFDELKEKITLLQPEFLLCQVKYCSLMYMINIFTYGQLSQKTFNLMGSEFENAIKKFYVNKNFSSHSKVIHCILAAYYYNMCDMKKDGKFCGNSGFAFRSLLYHMFHGNLYKELSILLCNHKFVEAVFRTNSEDQLLDYYTFILYDILPTNQKVSREIDQYCLFSFYDFISRNFHVFHQYPQLVMQQALNEHPDSAVTLQHCDYYSLENLSRSDMLDYRIATLSGFVKNITACAGDKVKPFVILGTEDGFIKVLDLSTRRVIRSIKGHVSTITFISFVGKNKICISSADATLSLWDNDDFSRIAVLEGHRHKVTGCCSDPAGSVLFSSGWDNSVRLWSLHDGRSISVIHFRCPINCIDHHPVKQQIACGLWNGNIEVWDTISIQKKLVFSNFSGSVKSIAYTPDGVNIISSFIQSEISIWSSEEGQKISSLKGHILPVKSLTYSVDDGIFISGSDDCTLKVWSTVDRSYFTEISESKFCPISLMEFMTENLLAVTFQNSEIWIIDANNGCIINETTLSSDTVSAFSKYSFVNSKYQNSECTWWEKSLVFGTKAGQLMIKNLLISAVITKAKMDSKITAVIHNCDIIICGTAEGDIGVFSHPDNRITKILYAAHRGFLSNFCFCIQNETLFALSIGNDHVLKLWNIEWENLEINLQGEFFNKHKDAITCSIFYPQSCDSVILNNLLTGSHDNNIILWNENSPKVFSGLQSSVINIVCSDDYILGSGNDGAIVMWSWNRTILTSIPGIELSSAVLTFYMAEDGHNKFSAILAFVDQDGSIKMKKPLERTYSCSFDSHSKPITSCCTTENGEVISCSLDGSVSLWKVPLDSPNTHFMHSSIITGIILSTSCDLAVSSDALGNLILWRTNFYPSASAALTYAGKKSYNGGFIRALSWLKDNHLVCAVTQVTGTEELYFLNIIHFSCTSVNESEELETIFNLEVKKSYNFESEVLCLDSCSITDTVVVGLKSGDVMVITPKAQRLMKTGDDWLLGIHLFTRENSSDLFCASFIDGSVKLFSVAEFLKHASPSAFAVYEPTSEYKGSKFTSSMCCGEDKLICCGDSEGILRIYSKHTLKFLEKIHNGLISGMCIIGSYLFTSSLDKTVKGWNLKFLKQVCQFHSNAPISSMSSIKTDSLFDVLLIGTTSGNLHLLKFHHK